MAIDQQQQQPASSFSTGASTPKAAPGELAAEIAATVDREPGDRVRVTWIGGDNYRCNWWAPADTEKFDNPGMFGLTVTTHVVRKSRFLSVSKTGDGLVIRDHARSGR
jgi:hypothetical protein